jgi:hypothetical protein
MTSALLGNKSIFTSEIFCFVFPHANVSYVNSLYTTDLDSKTDQNEHSRNIDDNNEYAQSCLDAVMAAVSKDDEHSTICRGTTSYKMTEGTVVFLTQAESYHQRGLAFANYSQIEFECIVQLQVKSTSETNVDNNLGRKPRPTFELGPGHPLYESHVGVIHMKMCTPMLAGAPPPKFPANLLVEDESLIPKWNKDMQYYSKYLIDLCVPWSDESLPTFERSPEGFCLLISTWNKKSATFLERQLFQFLSNFMSKGHRSSHNENAATAWRQHNADWWSEMKRKINQKR